MISLSDDQLKAVMVAASILDVDDRAAFLRLIAEQLKPRTVDVTDAVRRAMNFFQDRGIYASSSEGPPSRR
jgi:hypothetical protein